MPNNLWFTRTDMHITILTQVRNYTIKVTNFLWPQFVIKIAGEGTKGTRFIFCTLKVFLINENCLMMPLALTATYHLFFIINYQFYKQSKIDRNCFCVWSCLHLLTVRAQNQIVTSAKIRLVTTVTHLLLC